MPTWAKVLLIVLLVSFIGIIGGVFMTYRWVKSNAGRIGGSIEEGKKFGKGKTVEQCVDASLARMKGDFAERLSTVAFNSACLQNATDSAEACAKIPSGIIDRALWAKNKCSGQTDRQGCQQIYQTVWQYCDSRSR